jgi:hypothetical protein
VPYLAIFAEGFTYQGAGTGISVGDYIDSNVDRYITLYLHANIIMINIHVYSVKSLTGCSENYINILSLAIYARVGEDPLETSISQGFIGAINAEFYPTTSL